MKKIHLRYAFYLLLLFGILTFTPLAWAPPTEPIDNATFAAAFDDLVKGSDTARNAQQWSTWASDTNAANKAMSGTWRTQAAARVLPRLTTVLRIALPLQEIACTADDVYAAVKYGEKHCTSIGWWIGGTINRYFHLTGDVGVAYTPGNASNYDPNSWRWQTGTPTSSSSSTGTGWDGVPGSSNYPYPCSGVVGTTVTDGCLGTSATVVELTPAQKPGSTGAGAFYYYLSTSVCYVQSIGGGSQSFAYSSGNTGYSCQWSTQAWGDTVNNYSQQAQNVVSAGRGHLWRFTPATSTDPGQIVVYATQDEYENWMTVDSESSTKPSSVTYSTSYTAPTYNTTTDRAAARTALKAPGNENARRYFDCQLDSTSTWCTDTSLTNPGVVAPPTTTTTTFTPFILPRPVVGGESYADYVERLRALGWLGTVTLLDDTTSYIAGSAAALAPAGSVTEVTVGTLTPAFEYAVPAGTEDTWPINAPKVATATDPIIITKLPGAIPSACSTCAVDWTPIRGIDYGSKFPFGFATWIGSFFSAIPSGGSCPTLSIGKPAALGGGTQSISFCSSSWESWRPTVFLVLEAFMTLAGIAFLATRILGMGGGDGGEETDAA